MAYENTSEERSGGGAAWLYVPIVLILFVGGAMSVGAYYFEPGLSILESLAAGFAAVAGLIIGLFAGAVGVLLGLLGAAFGIVVAGGAVATTLFVLGSPIIAIVLIVLLMRRRGGDCPDPSAHK